jgi:hypothetical protein
VGYACPDLFPLLMTLKDVGGSNLKMYKKMGNIQLLLEVKCENSMTVVL